MNIAGRICHGAAFVISHFWLHYTLYITLLRCHMAWIRQH
jgi:hypothetical protein